VLHFDWNSVEKTEDSTFEKIVKTIGKFLQKNKNNNQNVLVSNVPFYNNS